MSDGVSSDSPQEDELTDAEISAFLEKSTLPSEIDICIDGRYDSEDHARQVANATLAFFRMLGVFLNLSGLEAVSVADDYKGALEKVEQGFQTTQSLAPTNDEFGNGLAMAVPVLRNGALKTHIVLHSGLARVLLNSENEMYGVGVHTLAHEAGHAHDHEVESSNLPGVYGSYIPDYKEGRLFLLAHKCWTEYIASHLSSRWGTGDYCKSYSDMLCAMLSTARERGNAALDRYREHQDILKVEREVIDAYALLLDRGSYLVGHIHGLGKSVGEIAPEFFTLVNETSWFKPVFERYEVNVRTLHGSYGKWSGVEVFEPLKQTFESLLNAGGMFYYRFVMDDRWRIGLNKPRD
jgi:hypothetical protein